MGVKYFRSDQYPARPPMILRRTPPAHDELYAAGSWKPTGEIVDYMAGENDFLEPVTEQVARRLCPAAF